MKKRGISKEIKRGRLETYQSKDSNLVYLLAELHLYHGKDPEDLGYVQFEYHSQERPCTKSIPTFSLLLDCLDILKCLPVVPIFHWLQSHPPDPVLVT